MTVVHTYGPPEWCTWDHDCRRGPHVQTGCAEVVNGNEFSTKVYDKRRDFNFDILGLPAFSSNIPSKMAFGIICSQFIRFAKICMAKEDFIYNCQLIINKINTNGFPMWILKKYVAKFQNNNHQLLLKFDLGMDLQHLITF